MNILEQILIGVEDGKEYLITFSWGDCLGLLDFEMVDKSIYDREDLCVADVSRQIKCDKRFYTVGTAIEFSLYDVTNVLDPENKEELYRREMVDSTSKNQ
jgi:hypothetical protein